ncbi:MAG TPA: ECF transporter S component [Firmicutes bacterium]|nr:ECF transporter S component [Bacillota bacterium]
MKNKHTLELLQLTMLGAIVFVLAFTPFLGYIPLGVTKATIIHIPVIIGAIILGPKKGAILGALFGLTSLIMNTISPTVTSFVFSPFYSIGDVNGNFLSLVICFVPRILVGVVPYYVYQALKTRIKQTTSLAVAGLAGSLTNTILVMSLIYLFFAESYAAAKGVSVNALYGVIMSIIGINGVPEAILASVLTASITMAVFKITKQGKAVR